MALTNYERQKRWRDRNRVIYNLRRRNARKNLPVPVLAEDESAAELRRSANDGRQSSDKQIASATGRLNQARESTQRSDAIPDSRGGQTISDLRELIKREESRPPVELPERPVVKPKSFFNDYGATISEKVWNELQEKKRIASEKGYEFDPQ